MGPLAHDFSRTMRSKSVILSMVVVILLSLALVPFVNLASSPITGNGGIASFGYYAAPDFHVLAYSYNAFGQPVQGTAFNLTITDASGTHGAMATSNSSGFASFDIKGNPPTGATSYVLRAGGFGAGGDIPVPGANGGVFEIYGSPISFVQDPSNSSRLNVLFVYEGDNGTVPSAYTLYYNFTSSQGGSYQNPTPQNMHLLGVPHGFASTWKLPPIPTNASTVTIGAFADNGSIGVLA